MVTSWLVPWIVCTAIVPWAQADSPQTLLQRLTPLNQLRVIMGLFVVIILGAFLFIVIKAGAHMVQGMSAPANRLKSNSLPSEDDWTNQPLNELPDDDD